MSRWGIGPAFTISSLLYGGLVIALTRAYAPDWRLSFIPEAVTTTGGIVLIIAGTAVFAAAVGRLHRAYHSSKLETNGVYAYLRHPIYAAFICLIVPGIVIMTRFIPALSIPLVMYLVFQWLIRAEEKYLEKHFGEEYLQYQQRVGAMLPKGKGKGERQRQNGNVKQ